MSAQVQDMKNETKRKQKPLNKAASSPGDGFDWGWPGSLLGVPKILRKLDLGPGGLRREGRFDIGH